MRPSIARPEDRLLSEALLLIASGADSLWTTVLTTFRPAPTLPTRRRAIRSQLLALVQRRPGTRLLDLWKRLSVNRGTVDYNLEMLERVGAVQSLRQGGATRFYPGSFTAKEVRQFALLLRGFVLEVVRQILERPGIGQGELLHTVDISRRVFRVYVGLLTKEGLLEEKRAGKQRRYFPTPDLATLYRRVTHVEPDPAPRARGEELGHE
jgi:DNA-binding IclR family transcriptional regulator